MYFLSRHTSALRRFAMLAFAPAVLAVIALLFSASADAFEVVVVKSAEFKPYRDVVRGISESCGCDVQEVNAGDMDDAQAVLRKSPDAVVAVGTGAFRIVRSLSNLPIVYTMVMPSEIPLPSRQSNLSGVSMDISPEMYIESMVAVFPHATRIGLLYDPRHTSAFVADAKRAAAEAGIKLVIGEVSSPSHAAAYLGSMRGKIDVFWMLPDPTVVSPETVDYLLRFSFQNNVPIFSFSQKYVDMGAVAALDIDPYDMGVQAGELVDRLARDASQTNRVYARKSRLSINVKVSKKMGLNISSDALKRAHQHD